MLSGLQNTSTWAVPKYFSDLKSLQSLDIGKYLTMSTEFDKNFSKWSYYSTDHKNNIKKNFEHFLSKLLNLQKSLFGEVILGIKLF